MGLNELPVMVCRKAETAREFCCGFPSLACFISQFTLSICEARIELSVRRAAREKVQFRDIEGQVGGRPD